MFPTSFGVAVQPSALIPSGSSWFSNKAVVASESVIAAEGGAIIPSRYSTIQQFNNSLFNICSVSVATNLGSMFEKTSLCIHRANRPQSHRTNIFVYLRRTGNQKIPSNRKTAFIHGFKLQIDLFKAKSKTSFHRCIARCNTTMKGLVVAGYKYHGIRLGRLFIKL